jgi:hypothetical protein
METRSADLQDFLGLSRRKFAEQNRIKWWLLGRGQVGLNLAGRKIKTIKLVVSHPGLTESTALQLPKRSEKINMNRYFA